MCIDGKRGTQPTHLMMLMIGGALRMGPTPTDNNSGNVPEQLSLLPSKYCETERLPNHSNGLLFNLRQRHTLISN